MVLHPPQLLTNISADIHPKPHLHQAGEEGRDSPVGYVAALFPQERHTLQHPAAKMGGGKPQTWCRASVSLGMDHRLLHQLQPAREGASAVALLRLQKAFWPHIHLQIITSHHLRDAAMQDGGWYIFQTSQGLDQFKGEHVNPWLIRHEKHSFITCMSHSPLSGEQSFLFYVQGCPKSTTITMGPPLTPWHQAPARGTAQHLKGA